MIVIDFLITPFADYDFMRRALAACVILAIGGTPLGTFMILRRMTLMGDAMSHAILPGVAIAFLVSGFALVPMFLGGAVAGVSVALLAMFLSRYTTLKEDASLTMLFLLSLAMGVIIVTAKGSNADLFHLLFGNILAIDNDIIAVISAVSCITLIALAWFYRGFVIAAFDPDFALSSMRGRGMADIVFFVLLVINLIAAFLALGTLLALGMLILPAIAAKFWSRNIDVCVPASILFAAIGSIVGLLMSYHANTSAGASVVLVLAVWAVISALFGGQGSVRSYFGRGG